MATVKNARDIILQAASTRVEAAMLPPNVTVSTPNLVPSSVTPDKTDIPAINPVSGDLADDAFLVTTGYVKAAGSLLSLVTYAGKYGAATGQFITSGGAANVDEWDIGVWGQLNGTTPSAGKIGVIGVADQVNGYGVVGVSEAGKALYGQSSSGYALSLVGKMEISDSTLVANLNAEQVGGKTLANLAEADESVTNQEYSTDGGATWNPIRLRKV